MNGSGIFGGHIFEGFGQVDPVPEKAGQSSKVSTVPGADTYLPGAPPTGPFDQQQAYLPAAAPAQDNTTLYVAGGVALVAIAGIAWMMSGNRKVTANGRRRGRRSRSRRGR